MRLGAKKMPFLFCELVIITIFAPDFGLFRVENPRNHRFFERTKKNMKIFIEKFGR